MAHTMFEARRNIRMNGMTAKDAIALAGGYRSLAMASGMHPSHISNMSHRGSISRELAPVVWEWIRHHQFVKWEEFREIVK